MYIKKYRCIYFESVMKKNRILLLITYRKQYAVGIYLHRNISFVHRVIQNDTTTSNKSNK